jgi:phage terminase large subunit GpA-like protein
MPDGGRVFAGAFAERIRPKPVLSVSEWADQHRVLSTKASSEPGPWRTSRVPYAREIMDALSLNSVAEEVIFVASVQVTKTEILLNFIGYNIDYNPSPSMVVLPTLEGAELWSKQRLAPMIDASAVLAKKLGPQRSRDGSNTVLLKDGADFIVRLAGANSATSLGQTPIQNVGLDEVDRYPRDVGADKQGAGEGDPVDLAQSRANAFARRKIYKASSPTIMSLSRIWKDWLRGSQAEYHLPCPHCRELQVLRRENLRYDPARPEETAVFVCIHCGTEISESSKPWMHDPANGARWIHAYPDRVKVRSYHLSAWYTVLGLGKSWGSLARRFEEVKRDPQRFKAFVNTIDGLCFEDPTEKLDWQVVRQRAGGWGLRDIPRDCLVITAGVDVQKHYLAVQVIGWGRELKAWVIDYLEIPGDPTQSKVWEDLDEYLQRPFVNAWQISMRIDAVAVDAGNWQDDVLRYTRPRSQRRVFAIKGIQGGGRTVLTTATKPDKNRRGRTSKVSVGLWLVSTHTAKEFLFHRLQDDSQRLAHDQLVVFPDGLAEEYFTQLTAEIWDPKSRRWVKQQKRNEANDTFNYALAAAHYPGVRLQTMKESDWARLEAAIQPATRDLFAPGAPPPRTVQTSTQPEPPAGEGESAEEKAARWIAPRRNWIKR